MGASLSSSSSELLLLCQENQQRHLRSKSPAQFIPQKHHPLQRLWGGGIMSLIRSPTIISKPTQQRRKHILSSLSSSDVIFTKSSFINFSRQNSTPLLLLHVSDKDRSFTSRCRIGQPQPQQQQQQRDHRTISRATSMPFKSTLTTTTTEAAAASVNMKKLRIRMLQQRAALDPNHHIYHANDDVSCSSVDEHEMMASKLGFRRDPRNDWIIHPDLEYYIRSSYSGVTVLTDHKSGNISNKDDDTKKTKKKTNKSQSTISMNSNNNDDDGNTNWYQELLASDSGLSICFLGTGSGLPSTQRNQSGTALRCKDGAIYLFDVGENMQHQMMKSKLHFSSIHKIFITHLHGDHIFGLPGLLSSIQLSFRQTPPSSSKKQQQQRRVVELYGPPGLYHYVVTTMTLSYTSLTHITIVVYELHGGSNYSRSKHQHHGLLSSRSGKQQQQTQQQHPHIQLRIIYPDPIVNNSNGNGNEAHSHEIQPQQNDITRNQKNMDSNIMNEKNRVGNNSNQKHDGNNNNNNKVVWTLCHATEITTPELAYDYSSEPVGLYVKAAELDHIPRLQCFGYVIEEPYTLPRTFDPKRALELGVSPGKKYRILKGGFPVLADQSSPSSSIEPEPEQQQQQSGTATTTTTGNNNTLRVVHPDDVLIGDKPIPRKVAILGDCRMVPSSMKELCYHCDVIVHEATFSNQDSGRRVEYGGHSSAKQAGYFANDVKAKVLILNHLSPSANLISYQNLLIKEASEEIDHVDQESETSISTATRNITRVQLAYDHMEIIIPKSGFQLDKKS